MAEPKREAKHEPSKKPQGPASIVRVAGKDVDGSLPIPRALAKVKGIGHNMSRALALKVESKLGITGDHHDRLAERGPDSASWRGS